MSKYDLAVLIPARNEEFVNLTVKNILENKRGKTEVIIGLDGQWADPSIPDHPDVTILYVPSALGQRAITNQCARLSTAKYFMKIDAHCAVSEGFDIELVKSAEEMGADVIQLPALYNLHAFDFVCRKCGSRQYQGPKETFEQCPTDGCNSKREREIIWKPRLSKKSEFYRFDTVPHFQYHGARKVHPEAQGDIVETMSAQGSCFFISRERYWEWNICDEGHGSWGNQGIEIACKAWLSGGRLVTNRKAWYSHMFRTQGGSFGFPYPLSGSDVQKARQYSHNLWIDNNWSKQVHPLSWLIEKFKPLPDWHEESGKAMLEKVNKAGEEFYKRQAIPNDTKRHDEPTKGIIFYTDNKVNLKIAHKVQNQLKSIGLPIVSASLKPMPHMGRNIHLRLERGYLTMFKQILAALEASTADIIFFCEHDVIYHPSHFEFMPPQKDKFYYNLNYWKFWPDGFIAHWDANQVSGLSVYREHAINYYRNRIKEVEENGFNRSYEPGGRDKTQYENWRSEYPNIDIRAEWNLTKSHRKPEDFRDKSTCINWEETTIDKIQGWDTDFLKQIFPR